MSANVAKSLKTTADMRQFLADLMVGVKNGHADLDVASRITKLAAQVNESFYAEIKVAKIRADAGEQMIGLGDMPIGVREKK